MGSGAYIWIGYLEPFRTLMWAYSGVGIVRSDVGDNSAPQVQCLAEIVIIALFSHFASFSIPIHHHMSRFTGLPSAFRTFTPQRFDHAACRRWSCHPVLGRTEGQGRKKIIRTFCQAPSNKIINRGSVGTAPYINAHTFVIACK